MESIFVYAVGHCALIFLAGLSMGLTESIVQSRNLQVFSRYSRKVSGMVLAAGSYLGITAF